MQTGSPGEGYLLAIVMIIMAVSFLYLNQKVIGTRKGYVTITGKAATKSIIRLGKYKTLISFCVYLFLFCVVVVPLLVLGIETIVMTPGNYSLSNFTTHFWIGKSNPSILSGQPGVLRDHKCGKDSGTH